MMTNMNNYKEYFSIPIIIIIALSSEDLSLLIRFQLKYNTILFIVVRGRVAGQTTKKATPKNKVLQMVKITILFDFTVYFL